MDLNEARSRIDEIDDMLIELFNKRMDLSAQIAEYKRARGLTTMDERREAEKLERALSKASLAAKPYAKDFLLGVMVLSRRYQDDLRKSGE